MQVYPVIEIGQVELIELSPHLVQVEFGGRVVFITSDDGRALDLALNVLTGQRVSSLDAFERSLDETCPGVDTKLVA